MSITGKIFSHVMVLDPFSCIEFMSGLFPDSDTSLSILFPKHFLLRFCAWHIPNGV